MEFSSKADILRFLQKSLKKSKIEKIFYFTVLEWEKDESQILNKICNNFQTKIIIRSSAIGEDSITNSQAGIYESILNIPPNSKFKVKNAINKIIKSYQRKGNFNKENQILVQNQTLNVLMSGVVFTRTEDLGSPFYVINYDEGISTDSVTKGERSKVVKIFRNYSISIEKKFSNIIESIKEVESHFGSIPLDIEFGLTKSSIVIFQVRPITFLKNDDENIQKTIEKNLKKNKNKFLKLSESLHQPLKKIIFSDMADWNPSEIIGNNPNLLDYSLYDFLLLKKEWREGRKIIGYTDVSPNSLMFKFGNKPYIDIIASFSSMIPASFDNKLKKKLLKYYIRKLDKNHHLHDKVEFEILFSCYDFSINKRLKELKNHDFSNEEIKKIKKLLIEFTKNIFLNFPKIFNNCSKSIYELGENRKIIQKELKNSKKEYIDYLCAAEKLLLDCKKNGTLPFSTMARIAFIGTILLKSMINRSYINLEYYEYLMEKIESPLSKLKNEFKSLSEGKITKKEFLKEFGHLRPGTYDITAPRYDKNERYFENIEFLKNTRRKRSVKKNRKISFKEHELNIQWDDFEGFIIKSLVQREELKFEFTRNLSDALELVAEASKKLGFTREEIANLDIQVMLNDYKKLTKNQIKSKWKKNIEKQIQEKKVNQHLVLPPLIKSSRDFEFIFHYSSKPNFISREKIIGDIKNIEKVSSFNNLQNKIILLENADPGYDWLFTKNIKGLITKYGGVASHMAIRCAETRIPAVIGCGEIIFEKLMLASKVMIDCKNQQIIILKHEKPDEFIEEKKALKSLGYIK
ncbi:MAG: hypothetical protein K5777_02980 [Nitrosopumilus sp.]|nr:hypothetical protein [Nitrosopumilus sp.]